MEWEKKPKLDHFSCCVACLQEHVDIDNINDLNHDIINIYKNLLQEQINQLAPSALKFCDNCIATLLHILEFQKQCLNSISSLSSHSGKLQFDTVFVKEEIDRDDGIEVKIEEGSIRASPEKISKRTRKQKVSTILPVAKKQELKLKKKTKEKKAKATKTITPKVEPVEKKQQGKFCVICNETVRSFGMHVTVHSTIDENKHYKCNYCPETCTDVSALEVHINKHSEYSEPRKCPDCDAPFKNRIEYRDHVVQHKNIVLGKNQKVYLCDYCNGLFTCLRSFKRHVLVKHQGGFKCKYCRRPFMGQKEYEKHMQKEELKIRPMKMFYCEICGYSTQWRTGLLFHIKQLHSSNEPKIICDECGKACKTRQHFKHHFITSHMEKLWKCTECGRKFSFAHHLQKHIRMFHKLETAFTDCQYCGKKFKTTYIYQHISSVHLNLRKFKCNLCDMTFTSNAVMKKHQHTHNKTRPYNCTLCPTGYYQNEYLRKHFERVHGFVYTSADVQKICGKTTLEEKRLKLMK